MKALVVMFIAAIGFCCALVGAGCSVAAPAPDMALRALDDYRCLGAEDVGRVMWWMGIGEPSTKQMAFDDHRYVCVDHGPDRHGFWYEMIPEER